MKNNEKKAEENVLELTKIIEEKNRQLLNLEVIFGIIITILFLFIAYIADIINVPEWIKAVIVLTDFVIFLIVCAILVSIEQKAGYYECSECHHKYVPTYKNVFWAPHFGRTRKMRCPKCDKRCWHKKVLK